MWRMVQLRLWLSVEKELQKETENNEMIKEHWFLQCPTNKTYAAFELLLPVQIAYVLFFFNVNN